MLSPVFDDDLRLLERVEDFAGKQFVTELRIEALAISVFPRAARDDGTPPAWAALRGFVGTMILRS